MNKLYVWGLGALAIAVLTGTIWMQRQTISSLKAQVEASSTVITNLTEASASKDEVLTTLQSRLAEWQTAAYQRAEAYSQAAATARAAQVQLATTTARLRALEDSDRELPDCTALMAVDLAAVCPGTATGVRERATRGFQGTVDRGSGPGAGSP